MLTNAAFNALLKTLEEPPSHVIFVLCTTDPQKLPVTIVSRCEKYNLVSISTDDIADRLQYISDQENLNLGENPRDTLLYIARSVDGGMRDAVKLLQKCSSLSDVITVATVIEALGNVDKDKIKALLQDLLNKDRVGVKDKLNSLLDGGIDSKVLVSNLIEFALEKIEDLLTAETPTSPLIEDLIVTSEFLANLSDELKFSTQSRQILTIRLIMYATPLSVGSVELKCQGLQGLLNDGAVEVIKNILNEQEAKILSSWRMR